MNLSDWQTFLGEHFAKLRSERSARHADMPLFALEHGLSDDQVGEISAQLKAYLTTHLPTERHALPWIVYATELGYRYSGYEYWQTFEAETPGWCGSDLRYWLRDRFLAFEKEFGGARPKGLWASHFSIICWPIAHAILPRDLQRHLAQVLYELRHRFSAELFESPSALGAAIAAKSWDAPARFQDFAQEAELTGQIAAALLFDGARGTEGFLLPGTRTRISRDLDSERRSREWLIGARRAANERASFKGGLAGRSSGLSLSPIEQAREELASLALEPRVLLRPARSATDGWDVLLEIPNLSALLERFPSERPILAESRCAVTGSNSSPMARHRLLDKSQRVTLARWPSPDEVLLKFERQSPVLEALLRTECLLRPGSTWLCRIASDGLAYELRGMRIRAGGRYVALTTGSTSNLLRFAEPCGCTCAGVAAFAFTAPRAIPSDLDYLYRDAGLTVAHIVRIRPVGLAAAAWDGEGHAQWPATEEPTIALLADYDVESAWASIGFRSLELGPLQAGRATYLSLSNLEVGVHRLRIATKPILPGRQEEVGELDITIYEPRPWLAESSVQGPVQVSVDPRSPSLEQLWQNEVSIEIDGPVGRYAACTVNLKVDCETAPLVSKALPRLHLPLASENWKEALQKYLLDTPEAQRCFDAATLAEVNFRFDEFGGLKLSCQRLITPLRWLVQRRDRHFEIRLLDDSGLTGQPTCSRYSFERPDQPEDVPSFATGQPGAVDPEGGLYVATSGDFCAAIIVPAVQRQAGFAALRCDPRLHVRGHSAQQLSYLVEVVERWSAAIPSGDGFSVLKRSAVLRALSSGLNCALCGDGWEKVESATSREHFWCELKRALRYHAAFRPAEELTNRCAQLIEMPCLRRVDHLTSVVCRQLRLWTPAGSSPIGPQSMRWLSELALRIASDPGTVRVWAGPHLADGLKKLVYLRVIPRVARSLALMVHFNLRPEPIGSGKLLSGWRWE